MMATEDFASHEEAWLMLPWLANGRLAASERERLEGHVSECATCAEELDFQRQLCNALTEPDRVTYAPGPSFRKLMERIDGPSARKSGASDPTQETDTDELQAARTRRQHATANLSTWRPPGLAWAASVVLAIGVTGLAVTGYRSTQTSTETQYAPVYRTHTDTAQAAAPNVLHISFVHSLKIDDVEELLQSAGARVVEGPDNSGIFGVTPAAVASGQVTGASANQEIQNLAQRLKTDSRVRWVQPVDVSDTSGAGATGQVVTH